MHPAPVDQTLDNGHLRLLELLLGVTASSVWEVDRMADLDVVGEGDVLDLDPVTERTRRGCPCKLVYLLHNFQYTDEVRTRRCPTCRIA